MNIILQSKRLLSFTILISLAIIVTLSFAKDKETQLSNPDKETSDSLTTQTKRGIHHLKYALSFNDPFNINSLLSVNPSSKTLNKPKGYILEDGTSWNFDSDLNSTRLFTMLGLVSAVDIVGYYRLKDLQYHWPTTKFHTTNFELDLKIYQQMDKYGHFLHAYFASNFTSKMYRWVGLSGESSIWLGTLTGWLWILQIEIADGFFEAWGFSWNDLIANTIGSGFSALQQLYPDELGGIQPKLSYTTSEALKERRYNNGANSMIDDYEGITWWLGVNVYHYLPGKIQQNYPDWLKPFGFAIGQSAKGIANNPHAGEREILIGLDFDLRKLPYGDENGLIRFLKSELNFIRLPLPAVKITPHGVWYGLYF
jgi:hypothetical protein